MHVVVVGTSWAPPWYGSRTSKAGGGIHEEEPRVCYADRTADGANDEKSWKGSINAQDAGILCEIYCSLNDINTPKPHFH